MLKDSKTVRSSWATSFPSLSPAPNHTGKNVKHATLSVGVLSLP